MNQDREDFILTLARILSPAPEGHTVISISDKQEIEVHLPRLADALMAAGYRKGDDV